MTSTDKPKRPQAKAGGRREARAPGAAGAPPVPEAGSERATQAPERIAKILARAGVASRRDAERMILEGRIALNGTVLTTPAVTATLADRIEVDGMPIRGIERTRLWLYYKPAGLVTTNSDPEGRPTVFDNLPDDLPRVLSIGRLDINTEGLLLLTNDGGLARVLELPATGWLRRYRVRAHGDIDQAALDRLKDGIAVDGVLYGGIEATLDRQQGANVWITMGLREGKNREIKNVLGALGLDVNRLIRISYGPFQLADLAEGAVREIRGRTLRDQLGPRLIADSGANFDAPVFDTADAPLVESAPAPAAETRATRGEEDGARKGRDRPMRRDDGGATGRRDRALSRLDTKRDDRGRDERPKRKAPKANRTTNVWMAPGARPLGPKGTKEAEEKARKAARRAAAGYSGRPASKGERFEKSVRKDAPHAARPRPGSAAASGEPRRPRAADAPAARRPDDIRADGARSDAASAGRPGRAAAGKPSGKGAGFGRPKGAGFGAGRPAAKPGGFKAPDRGGADGAAAKPRGPRPEGKPRRDGPSGKGSREGRGDGPRAGKPRGDGGRGKPGADRRR